jgi:hypothetical protein
MSALKRHVIKICFVIPYFIMVFGTVQSQEKQYEIRNETWFGYFNQTRFSQKSGLWVDLHLRLTDNFGERLGQSLVRAGYVYYLSDQVRLTAGYGYITNFGLNDLPNINEHRPWQQIQWFDKKSWYTQMQYLRLEERFREEVSDGELTGDYTFNYRVRYNFAMSIPLKGKEMAPKVPFIFVNNELHINFGEEIVYNYFDQNRLFAGIGYQFTNPLNAQVGYMYLFQQLASGNTYVHDHVIRLFIFHNLDFRQKEDSPK